MRQILYVSSLIFMSVVLTAQTAVWPVLNAERWRSITVPELARLLRINDVNAQYTNGKTALHLAAEFSDNPELIKFLLNSGANVYAETRTGLLPLHIAAAYNNTPLIVSILFDYTLQPLSSNAAGNILRENSRPRNTTGNTVYEGSAFGNTVYEGSAFGNTVYENHALRETNPAMYFMHADPDLAITLLNQADFSYTPPPIPKHHYTYTDRYQYRLPSSDIKANLRAEKINARSEIVQAPLLMIAIENENPRVLFALLQAGADVTVKTPMGRTALHRAAALNSNPTITRLLIDAGINIHAKAYNGKTALHYAAAYNTNPGVLTALLDAGADPTIPDDANKTAWDYIQVNENLIDTNAYWTLHDILYN